MKIGIISDTHGMTDAWKKSMSILSDSDMIIHGGDILYHPPRLGFTAGYDIPDLCDLINSSKMPVIMTKGNCDSDVYEELLDMPIMSPCAYTQFNGIRFIATHGHTIDEDYIQKLSTKGIADILITGHTHIPLIRKIGNMYHINPGSPAFPKWKNSEGIIAPTVGSVSDRRISIIDLTSGKEAMGIDI